VGVGQIAGSHVNSLSDERDFAYIGIRQWLKLTPISRNNFTAKPIRQGGTEAVSKRDSAEIGLEPADIEAEVLFHILTT